MLLLSCPQWGSGQPLTQANVVCPASAQGSNNGNLVGYLESASGTGPLNVNTPQASSAPISSLYNAKNQIVMPGIGYDAAGNMNALNTFSGVTYDAENRLTKETSSGAYTYRYDGNGWRVTKAGDGTTTTYVYDVAGELAAEYSSMGILTPPCATCYLSYDHLGNVRLVTDASHSVISRHDFLPFGE